MAWEQVPLDESERALADFDNIHTLGRQSFRRSVTTLAPNRMHEACRVLADVTGC